MNSGPIPQIIVDARMYNSSGIGVYIKNITNGFKEPQFGAIIGLDLLKDISSKFSIQLNAKIYSIKEQVLFPFVIPTCSVFWSPHYNVPIFPIRAKKRIVTIHDVYHISPYSALSGFKKWYAKFMIYSALRLSHKVITVSDFSKNEILKYFKCDPCKIIVIRNGVNEKVKWKEISEIQSRYHLPEKYILFVGNVKPHKNIRKLLEAYLLLNSEIQTTYEVVIVGKKDGFITEDKALLEWIQEDPILSQKVLFTGFVDNEDLDTIYHSASLFVFPSLYEGFGLPPLEAMANNCPTLVSNIPVMLEVCGDAALYFNPNDAHDIMTKIKQVISNDQLKQLLIAKGKLQIKMFDWRKSLQKHAILFESLFQ